MPVRERRDEVLVDALESGLLCEALDDGRRDALDDGLTDVLDGGLCVEALEMDRCGLIQSPCHTWFLSLRFVGFSLSAHTQCSSW